MRLSNYTKEVQLDEENYLLYNTMSRKYYQYIKSEKNKLWKILSLINKDRYSLEEIKLLQELMSKHIVIDDNEDEMRKLEYLENTMFYKNDIFHITVYATNACNFRCTYCSQEHAIKNIENHTVKNLIDVVKIASVKYKKIIISWFGGEPLLQYEKIIWMLSEMNKICIINNCILESDMVTNGYLLNEKMIEEMKEMHIRVMQITVDGCKSIHDKRRVLADKNGTYDKIVENIIKATKVGIKIILRINIDKESLDKNMDVLDDIPYKYRKLINIDVENVFENKGSNSVYSILLRAIEM